MHLDHNDSAAKSKQSSSQIILLATLHFFISRIGRDENHVLKNKKIMH
jgi:hypothetical protein